LAKHQTDPNQEEKAILLRLARNAIQCALDGTAKKEHADIKGWLSTRQGAFVSIHSKSGELRGCIGRFRSRLPLYRLVEELAISTATRDHRFVPIKKEELDNIVIEISILSRLQRIQSLDEIDTARHGIYIIKGDKSGTYLPQVLRENHWDAETAMRKCSHDKAGLGYEGWREAELYVYTSLIIGEMIGGE